MTTSSETHLQENTPRRYRRVLRLLVFAAAALLMFTAALCFYITQPIIGSQSTTNSSSVDPHRLESHVRALSQTLTPRDASYPDSDILIIKNKEITDTSYANIAFWDGSKWLTPANPLLSGVKRQFLMNRGSIFPADIRLNDLHLFKHAVMINAMLDLEDSPVIDLRNIR